MTIKKQCYIASFKLGSINNKWILLLQVLIFSQSLLYAAALWFITPTFESAIYGFMLGSISTIIAVLFQCHKTYCFRHQIRMSSHYKRYTSGFSSLVKPLLSVMVLVVYSPSII